MGAQSGARRSPVIFDSWGDFVAMGGHGLYVWLSYGLSVAVVLANVLVTRISRRRYLQTLADRARRR